MNKGLISIAVILIVVIGGFFLFKGDSTGSVISGNDENTITFTLTSSNLRFFLNGVESPELKVKQGDKVKIILNNEEGFHD